MTDIDPEIWNNPTLGAAANNERLDRLEKQQLEDRNAKLENREPREVVVDNTYPGWTPELDSRTGTVPSNLQVVHFADEQPNDIPVDSGVPAEENASSVADENPTVPEAEEDSSEEVVEDESTESDSTSEGTWA
jgi:hypothetical protein